MTTPTMKNEPQLSAEMEIKEKFFRHFCYNRYIEGKSPHDWYVVPDPEVVFNWFATALAQERERVVEGVMEVVNKMQPPEQAYSDSRSEALDDVYLKLQSIKKEAK